MARYINPIIQYSDGNGVPLPGATLDFFEPGTTTRKNTYFNSSLEPASANPNPVVADSAGVMPDIWLDGTYKVVLKNAGGVVQPEGTKDPVGATIDGQWELWLNDNTYNIPDLVVGSDNLYYKAITNANQGNDPTSSPANWEEVILDSGGSLRVKSLIHVQDQKASGTDGGTFNFAAWQTRALNTVLVNTITGASLSSNQITLPAGEYVVESYSTAFKVGSHAARIFNISDAAVITSGSSVLSAASDDTTNKSICSASFTIVLEKIIELQHRCQTDKATNGFGVAAGGAFTVDNELYSDIKIWKVD